MPFLNLQSKCYRLDFPIIKPHFIETSRLNIGVSEGNIDGITVKIYDRERVVCDCLRHVNTMDGEVFNTVIQRYIGDKKKDAAWCGEESKKGGWNMAVKEIKDMGASVLTRLKKQAKETGINYQTCLQLFAQEEYQVNEKQENSIRLKE